MRPSLHDPSPLPAPALPGRRRGSVLIVALLVSALIALVLGSYLSLNLGAARLSQRTFNHTAAFHLAEAGLEEGLWTYNQLLANQPAPWAEWQDSGDAAWRRYDGFQLAAATTGSVKVYATPVAPAEDSQPSLVALASVLSPGAAPVTQMLEVTLRRRSFFAAGLVARDRLVFRGKNTTFDGWDSDPDQNPATAPVPYAAAVKLDTGSIATGAPSAADLSLNQARIHGHLHTSGIAPDVGPTGLIGPFGTADGVIDPSCVGYDYNAEFAAVTPPAAGTLVTTFGSTLGTLGQTTLWRSPALRLAGVKTLTILGDVTLVLTDPIDALSLAGKASILIPSGSKFTVYALGDVQIAGNGIVNANATPGSFQLWSTEPGARAQRVALVGNGSLSGVVYAPEADVTLNGNGAIYGSIVGRTVTLTGNAAFHYDKALGRLIKNAPYRASGWRSIDDPARRAALLPLVDR